MFCVYWDVRLTLHAVASWRRQYHRQAVTRVTTPADRDSVKTRISSADDPPQGDDPDTVHRAGYVGKTLGRRL